MLLTITLSILTLVAINFLLLFFSCSKTNKKQKVQTKRPVVIRPTLTKVLQEETLAPTGS